MTWTVEWDDRARRELRRLDHPVQKTILKYFREHITTEEDPRRFGKALTHDLQGLWRYRVSNHRMVCQIEDTHLVVLVVRVAHRSSVYR